MDLRSALIERMNTIMDDYTARMPTAIPIAMPTGALADAAIDVIAQGGGIPRVPAYEPELFGQRRWYQPVDADQLHDGVSSIGVDLDLAGVRVMATSGEVTSDIVLPERDAEEFALATLAVVAAARE